MPVEKESLNRNVFWRDYIHPFSPQGWGVEGNNYPHPREQLTLLQRQRYVKTLCIR